MTNDAVDPSNFQLINFVMNNTFSDAANAARIMCYLSNQSNVSAAGTRVAGVSSRAAGTAGATDIPFPVAEFATLKALGDADGFGVTAQSAYNLGLGTGTLAPLGTSISVSERTAFVGPKGRGRHFLGFIQRGIVTNGGRVDPSTIESISDAYDYWMGLTAIGPLPANTGVTPSDLSAFRIVISVKPQPVFSNLESRRR
jgi:hypothetical protein